MGIRTHLTLKKPQRQIYIKEIEKEVNTYICYLENYCIGKAYFNDIPYIDGETIYLTSLWYNEYADNGEIKVKDIITLLNFVKTTNKLENQETSNNHNAWLKNDFSKLEEKLKILLDAQLIEKEDYVQFEVW